MRLHGTAQLYHGRFDILACGLPQGSDKRQPTPMTPHATAKQNPKPGTIRTLAAKHFLGVTLRTLNSIHPCCSLSTGIRSRQFVILRQKTSTPCRLSTSDISTNAELFLNADTQLACVSFDVQISSDGSQHLHKIFGGHRQVHGQINHV